MSSIDEERLIKLKQFIIDKVAEERSNPVITTGFRIEVPVKTITELFNETFVVALQDLKEWLIREFPNKSYKVYIEDRPLTDVYIELY